MISAIFVKRGWSTCTVGDALTPKLSDTALFVRLPVKVVFKF